jgi:peptide/nickel transport system ATP-binding protein
VTTLSRPGLSAHIDPRDDTTTPLLDVESLTVDVRVPGGLLRVIDEVDLQVRRSGIVGVVGESGSGKTVMSLAVMGLLPRVAQCTKGAVRFEGRDLLRLSNRDRRQLRGSEMAMIYQDALGCLNPAFTVGDQIAEAVRVHQQVSKRESWARARELLELVEIPNAKARVHDYPHMLSGGTCQRAMIALALSCNPKILFADEPTTALDVTVQKQILRLLVSIRRELGLAIVLVTHDLGVICEVADRVAVMYAGHLVEQGTVEEVFCSPRHPYTEGLIGSIPKPRAGQQRRFGSIPGTVPPPGDRPDGCRFHPRCNYMVPGRCDTSPIGLLEIGTSTHLSRCVRVEELSLAGVPS